MFMRVYILENANKKLSKWKLHEVGEREKCMNNPAFCIYFNFTCNVQVSSHSRTRGVRQFQITQMITTHMYYKESRTYGVGTIECTNNTFSCTMKDFSTVRN